MREIDARLQARSAQVVWQSHVGQPWRDTLPADAPRPKVVIVNGEGTIHHTADSARARDLVRVAAFARNELGARACLINATLHAIAGPELEGLRLFDTIHVRDGASRDELARAGIDAGVVPDITVAARLPAADVRRAGIAATDSVVSADARALKRASRTRGWAYWPMTYRFRVSAKRWPRLDAAFPDFAKAALGLSDPVAAFAGFIQRRELLVTGRYHAVTFCLATGTPFVAVESNTPKISSLVRDVFGDTRRVIPAADLARFDPRAFAVWSDGERRALDAFVADARRKADAMFDAVVGGTAEAASR